ncbi:DUF3017 domain-containing protein [Nocardioides caeni]|uniref:DUF3017 domain-containing protein n=1 Tax=Nocardioides caeni TaxID=574700 RepID=A0A4S8N3R9_9ACTN|nr:DUF3017 domain-containing protein [Nocardioides caeni]THV10733.1 DUF3017 domain-containing protein [Nocardioides caeni]
MGDRRLGLAQPRWGRPDDPRHAAGQRRDHGREAGRALNEETPDPVADGELPDLSELSAEPLRPHQRWSPQTIGGWCYLAILGLTIAGIVVAASSEWRLGLRIVAGALALAAALRLTLPEKDAGMLAVRHRLVDVGVLVSFATAVLVLAATVPDQPS